MTPLCNMQIFFFEAHVVDLLLGSLLSHRNKPILTMQVSLSLAAILLFRLSPTVFVKEV
jgi:hypothetical protein